MAAYIWTSSSNFTAWMILLCIHSPSIIADRPFLSGWCFLCDMASIVVGGAPGMEIGAEITLQIVIQAALEVMIVAVASCKSSSSLPDTISVFQLYNSTSSKAPRGRTVTILYDPRYILLIKLSTSTMIEEGSYNVTIHGKRGFG